MGSDDGVRRRRRPLCLSTGRSSRDRGARHSQANEQRQSDGFRHTSGLIMTIEPSAYIRHHESVIAPLHKDCSLKMWDLSLDGNNAALEAGVVAARERFLK